MIDTTGAGDNWAAGFLSGYLRGLSLEHCGKLGSMAGVQLQVRALPATDWSRIRAIWMHGLAETAVYVLALLE